MKSCLIVDDSKVIRKVARHILETLNFEVDEAGDGQEALTRCEAKMPDVVLLAAGIAPNAALDTALALAIVALGVAIAVAPESVPGYMPAGM